MVEQNQLNMGVADQSRISMAESTDNTPSNSNDLSIGIDLTKKMDPRSLVWQHFEKVFENGVLVKGKCLHCKQYYADNTTRNEQVD